MNSHGWKARALRTRRWVCVVLGIAVVATVVALRWWTRDEQEAPPRLVGSVWSAEVEGTARLFFVMEEQRRRNGFYDIEGAYSFSLPYSIFTLHARAGRDGAAPLAARIARTDGGVVDYDEYEVRLHLVEEPEILGSQDGVLWLWNDGPEARRLDTLERVWTAANLKERNPELGALLPAERKYFKVIGTPEALTYQGSDARYFRIDPLSGRIDAVDDAVIAALRPDEHTTAAWSFSSLRPHNDALRGTSPSAWMWTSLLDEETHTWYGLLTPEERVPDRWVDPRYGFGPSGAVARSLHRAPFKREDSRTTSEVFVLLDPASAAKVSEQRFLMGGFLRHPHVDRVWAVEDTKGTAFFVLHREALGEDRPWHVTRLGTDGGVHWTRDTGLADLQQLSDGDGAIVITGFADHTQPRGARPDLMVFIDEATGHARALDLVTGASRGGP